MFPSRASDALPITQAHGMGSDSPGMYASLDSPAEKGQAVTPVPHGVETPMLHTEASPDVSVKGKTDLRIPSYCAIILEYACS